jgi:hypothetical protein
MQCLFYSVKFRFISGCKCTEGGKNGGARDLWQCQYLLLRYCWIHHSIRPVHSFPSGPFVVIALQHIWWNPLPVWCLQGKTIAWIIPLQLCWMLCQNQSTVYCLFLLGTKNTSVVQQCQILNCSDVPVNLLQHNKIEFKQMFKQRYETWKWTSAVSDNHGISKNVNSSFGFANV